MLFPLFYSRNKSDFFEAKGTSLQCQGEKIPIINGIPRFVSSGKYASLFGDQWQEFKKTQLDSYTGLNATSKRLDRCLGEFHDKLAGKTVLEAGCGAGRFTEVLLKKGCILVSSDISTAVDVNNENFPVSESHLIIQADINNMPFQNNSFDFVICLGVIQHTPSPEVTIRDLFQLVKPGGTLIIDHYTFSKSYWFRLASVYRYFLRGKDASKTIPYTKKLVDIFLPFHKKFARSKVLSLLLNRVSPVISYYSAFPELSEKHQKEWALLDTHDSLTDYYKNFRNKKQIVAILEKLGGINIWCEYGGNGVEARCTKKEANR